MLLLIPSAGPQAAIVEQDPIDALLNMLQKYDIATKWYVIKDQSDRFT